MLVPGGASTGGRSWVRLEWKLVLVVFAQVEWQKVNGLLSCGFLQPSLAVVPMDFSAIKMRTSHLNGEGELVQNEPLVLRLQLMKLLQVHLQP